VVVIVTTFNYDIKNIWWYMLIIPTLRRLRQEDCEFKASLGYLVSLFPKTVSKESWLVGKYLYTAQDKIWELKWPSS
jgi:hypothetical protein